MIKTCRLLEHDGVFGFIQYVSMFNARASGDYQRARDAEKVYQFKKHGRNADVFGAMIQAVAVHFDCGVVLACPGHTGDETQLQKLLGGDLVRTAEVKSRKYNHKAEIDYDAEAATLDLRRPVKGERVLIVDDVCTTGRTLGFFRRYLRDKGAADVVCLSLGISAKLKPNESDVEISYAVREAKSGAERAADFAARHSDVGADFDAALAEVDWRRRRRCEKSLVAFAATYCTGEGGFLETKPPKSMQGILEEMQTAIGDASIPYHIRVARGHGKTSYMKCAVAWALSYGVRRYIVSVSADADKAKAITRDIVAFMESAPKWVQDFPEVSVPLKRLGGAYQRARSQTCHGDNTEIRLSANEIVLPTVWKRENGEKTGEKYLTSGAIMAAVGIHGNVRGLVRGSVRPDLVLLDDIQNDKQAKNDALVAEIAHTIRTAFMGLAGHRRRIAAIQTSTPIKRNDLSETFAADKAWKTTTYKMVISFPSCFGKESGDLWREYATIYEVEKQSGRPPHIEANKFYRAHRAEMDAGAEVLNPDNYERKTELSAIQHALNLYYRDGPSAFMSEYQMETAQEQSLYNLTPGVVLSRIRKDWQAFAVPSDSVMVVCATDINPSYGLSSAMVTFDRNSTATVIWHNVYKTSIHKEQMPEAEYRARVYEALVAFAKELKAMCEARGITLDAWAIDGGGDQFEPAQTLRRNAKEFDIPFPVVPMVGRAGDNWNPHVKSRIREAINETVECGDVDRDGRKRRWVYFNADFWRETQQRAWLGEIGTRGGLSLFTATKHQHLDFALQVSAEVLESKTPGDDGKRPRYLWRGGNKRHDLGDAATMCLAVAASKGLTQGVEFDGERGRHKNRRKVYNG